MKHFHDRMSIRMGAMCMLMLLCVCFLIGSSSEVFLERLPNLK